VIAKLDPEGGAIDQAARILLEDPDSIEGSLRESLDLLIRRWRKYYQSELLRQIQLAEQEDDQTRLAQLLEEKNLLSRSLHPQMTGKLC
jgi:hypothetical protein